MATTKKSSRAKTQTSAKITKSAKATKKVTQTKSVSSVPKSKITIRRSMESQLRMLTVLTALLSLVGAVAAGLLMNNTAYQFVTGLLTKDELASNATTVFVPAVHVVANVELRWIVVVIMILAAILPLLLLTRLSNYYQASLKGKVNLLRWIDTAVVGALILETVALLSGVNDIMTLKLIGGLVAVTCLLGWLSEKHHARQASTGRGVFVLSLITGALPWLLIASYAAATPIYGFVRSPWYVYALYATTLLGFTAYCLNNKRFLQNTAADYEKTERNYLQISLFVKVAFAVILIVGLQK
ncbi:MAG: heliorhodopsin HeR [Patescibacteria group bacterium]